MYQALYRKYRPKTFDDVVGQKIVIKTLINSILKDKISHAYLFTGPRGTGKTSVAKIFSKVINCSNLEEITPCDECTNCIQFNKKQNIDIIEIDAASNNGVDEIRELRDKVNLVPSYGKYKVYIIDEVHMLTQAAFNALLKTLEEPPKHVIFILATTEPHKIPLTILSRCQRFDFKKIAISEIVDRLKFICSKENIEIDESALELVAQISDGGMRDSVSLVDQLSIYASSKITVDDVNDVCGIILYEDVYNFIYALFNLKTDEVFEIIEKYDNEGKNFAKTTELIIKFLKDILISVNTSAKSPQHEQMYNKILARVSENKIYETINIFMDFIKSTKTSNNVRLLFELSIIKILNMISEINKIQKNNEETDVVLENKISEGISRKLDSTKKVNKNRIDQIKKIRINNTLALYSKRDFIEFKNDIVNVKNLIFDSEFSSSASLILDGELKAKGGNYIIFLYSDSNLAECFNYSLQDIQKVLKKEYNKDYKPIAVNISEWEQIKTNFNNSIKSNSNIYKYMEDSIDITESDQNSLKVNQSIEKNDIDDIFSEIIEYK